MTPVDHSQAAAARLREVTNHDDGDDDGHDPIVRSQTIAALATALHARRTRIQRMKWLRRAAAGLAVAALPVTGILALSYLRSGDTNRATISAGARLPTLIGSVGGVSLDGAPVMHPESVALREGSLLQTRTPYQLQYATGTRVDLDAASALRLTEQSAHQVFALQSGSMFAHGRCRNRSSWHRIPGLHRCRGFALRHRNDDAASGQ
jgi:hypothetical protein